MKKNHFFKQVHEAVKTIPAGKVMTYGQIAEIVNSSSLSLRKISPKLVGWALHSNRDPNVPCHRVVNREGKVALNYAFDGWKEQKRKLLAEGVRFIDEMRVDLGKCQCEG